MIVNKKKREKLYDAAQEVVVRFKAHDTYGSREKAIKALSRRAPGFRNSFYERTFDALACVYDRAVRLVEQPGAKTWKDKKARMKKSKYSEYEDIDFNWCMKKLSEVKPGTSRKVKASILNWVIFWHYLK